MLVLHRAVWKRLRERLQCLLQRQVMALKEPWLGRRFSGLNKRQICSKEEREQRSGRSQPYADLFFSEGPAWPVAAALCRALANSPSRNIAKWISSSLSPAQDLAENKASSLDSSKPPGIPAMLLLYRVPEKKGEETKSGKKNLCQAAPMQLEEAGSAELAGEDTGTRHCCILTACALQSNDTIPAPGAAKPFRARPGLAAGFWFLHGSTAGRLSAQKLLAPHTAPRGEKQPGSRLGHDGDAWCQGQAPGRCRCGPAQLHEAPVHEEGSIHCVPWDGVSILCKAGSERLQVCEQRQVQAVCAQSILKTSEITWPS